MDLQGLANLGEFISGLVDPSTLKPQERIQFTWAAFEMFGAFEFMFHQSRVKYAAADALAPPPAWTGRFDHETPPVRRFRALFERR